MSVTREQAQILTALAIACRPYGAPTWDHAGVMDMIGRVKDRALPEVALAVIRAAADREAKTPGVIPTAGTHWQEQLKPPKFIPDSEDHHLRCSVCGQRQFACETRPRYADDDHEYSPAHAKPATDVARTVAELRAIKHQATTPTTGSEQDDE